MDSKLDFVIHLLKNIGQSETIELIGKMLGSIKKRNIGILENGEL
jgi:hypothetical protein